MIKYLKSKISDTNPLRLFYHKMMAVVAVLYYRFPANRLIGITGTKGKTTTTNLIASVLQNAGYKVGMTSTLNFRVGDRVWGNRNKMTTLSPFVLQKMLREMVSEGCSHAVLEVSSHAITQNRIWGVNFDTAVFTNMGEDHLEYHGGFNNYLRTKGLLFSGLNRSSRKPGISKVSVLNRDDDNFSFFDQFLVDRKYVYGLYKGDCYASNVEYLPTGTKFTLHVPNASSEVFLHLPGEYNIYNALAAVTVGLVNNVNIGTLKDALEKASVIPGRYEAVKAGQDFDIIVDYAHTVESLENLLKLYKGVTSGKVIVVFGATGGGRDKWKREKMGAVADKLADVVVLTDDDPYDDDEWNIIEDIAKGVKRNVGESFWKVPNRREAIELALSIAKAGDTVVLAGKGGEEVQVIYGKTIKWDDRQVVKEILGRALTVEL